MANLTSDVIISSFYRRKVLFLLLRCGVSKVFSHVSLNLNGVATSIRISLGCKYFTTEFVIAVSNVEINGSENTRSVTDSGVLLLFHQKRIYGRIYRNKSISQCQIFVWVADPGFPRRGTPTPEGGAANILFDQFSWKTAWKWKKIGPEGGTHPLRPPPPLDPPLGSLTPCKTIFECLKIWKSETYNKSWNNTPTWMLLCNIFNCSHYQK